MSYEYKFIYAVLVFYGFLFLMYSLNGYSLYDINFSGTNLTYSTPPQPTGNALYDWFNSATNTASMIFGFFTSLFITPFLSGSWAFFGFINWALFGTMIYLFIRIIRGGG